MLLAMYHHTLGGWQPQEAEHLDTISLWPLVSHSTLYFTLRALNYGVCQHQHATAAPGTRVTGGLDFQNQGGHFLHRWVSAESERRGCDG